MASAFSYQRRLSPHVPPLIRMQHWFNPPHFFCGSVTAAGVFSYTFLRLGRVASPVFEREGIGADKASITR